MTRSFHRTGYETKRKEEKRDEPTPDEFLRSILILKFYTKFQVTYTRIRDE